MKEKLKVGIVGCGAVAQERHIPGFTKVKNKVILQAVCDKNEELASRIGRQYGISGIYPDISEMLAKEKLDIVDICVPQQIHAPLAIKVLEHGINVLIEKPMAMTASECDDIIATSHKYGGTICTIHNVLFHPPFLKAKELVAEGAIGTFTGMRIFLSDHRDEMIMRKDYWVHKLPGGVIGETGPHTAYMSLAFLDNVKSVDVHAQNFLEHPWAPFDEFRMEIEAENGMSSVFLSYTGNRHNLFVDILGTEGSLQLDMNSMLVLRQKQKTSLKPIDLARQSLGTACQIAGGVVANALSVLGGKVKLGHDIIIERFVDSIRNGTEPPVAAEEGREATRLVEMMVTKLKEKYGI